MTNEEKRNQIYPYYEDMEDYELVVTNAKRIGFIAGCEWKDKQNKWHKVEDGDLPKEDGNYLLVMKMKYARREGTSRSYMNVSQFSMKDGWKDPYGDDFAEETIFVAWMELPKYEEE